jgi:hypothetical protein
MKLSEIPIIREQQSDSKREVITIEPVENEPQVLLVSPPEIYHQTSQQIIYGFNWEADQTWDNDFYGITRFVQGDFYTLVSVTKPRLFIPQVSSLSFDFITYYQANPNEERSLQDSQAHVRLLMQAASSVGRYAYEQINPNQNQRLIIRTQQLLPFPRNE